MDVDNSEVPYYVHPVGTVLLGGLRMAALQLSFAMNGIITLFNGLNMKTRLWSPFFLSIAFTTLTVHSFTQKIPITSCTSSPASVVGHECEKAYDGNTGTNWTRPQALQTVLQFNFGKVRRIKYIKVSFTGSSIGPRNYTIIDKLGAAVDISVLNTNVLEDQITLAWGADPSIYSIDTMPDASALIISSYSTQIYSIKEVEIYGPGNYTNDNIVTVNVPIPAWNMNASTLLCLDLPSGITPNRVVGISAVIRSDINTIHSFSKLKTASPDMAPIYPNPDKQQAGAGVGGGGTVGITFELPCTPSSPFKWKIFLNWDRNYEPSSFKASSYFSSLSTVPRGYIKIEYLSSSPDFQ